jgi:hypothetical protein
MYLNQIVSRNFRPVSTAPPTSRFRANAFGRVGNQAAMAKKASLALQAADAIAANAPATHPEVRDSCFR